MKPLVAAVAAVAALAFPSLAFAGVQAGVVAKLDVRAGLVAVVRGNGAVSLIHLRSASLQRVRPGSRVVVDASRLRNGTYAGKRVSIVGAVRRVHVRGMIIAVDAKHASFALSAHGAVLPLRLAKHARVLASCGCPGVNSSDEVTLEFGPGGAPVAAAVTQVDPTADAGAIDGTVSADTGGEVTVTSGAYAITVLVPAWFDPSKLAVGEHVLAYFVRRPDGSYAIEAVANDGSVAQADEPAGEQGDLQSIDAQVGADEQSDEEADGDQTDLQLAETELADDEAAMASDLEESARACSAHVDELKASGASAADLATASAECAQQLAQAAQQADQNLQDCEQQLNEQVAGDPEAEQQLTQDEQQAEQDLQQSQSQGEQDIEDGSPDADSSGSRSEASVAHR